MTTAVMSEAQLRTHYAGIKARLYGKPRPANTNRKPEPVVEIECHEPQRPKYRLVMAPQWKLAPTQFNYHVVLYRQHLLAVERASIEDDYSVAPDKPSMTDIANEVLQDFPGVTMAELKGIHRKENIVRARQMAIYQIRTRRPDLSYPVIGRFFGGRDHTTCIHAVQKIERLMAQGAEE